MSSTLINNDLSEKNDEQVTDKRKREAGYNEHASKRIRA